MIKKFSIAMVLLAGLIMSFALISNWNITGGSEISFKLGMVAGSIGGLKGSIAFDPGDPTNSNMDITLDLSTITTGNGMRDKDIKNESVWFDSAKFPKIAFKSSSVTQTATGYLVEGTLTMKGISKKIQIPFKFAHKENEGTFIGTFTLNRLDYGVGKSSILVKDSVEVLIAVPVKR